MDPSTPPRRRLAGLAALGAAAIAVVAFALIAAGGLLAGPDAAPPVADAPDDGAAGGGAASCLMFDPATLASQGFAFAGTVTELDGSQVTFAVDRAYAGVATGDTISLADGSTGITLDGGPEYTVGGRYLVSGNDGLAWACGYSVEWTAADAAVWDAAFGG